MKCKYLILGKCTKENCPYQSVLDKCLKIDTEPLKRAIANTNERFDIAIKHISKTVFHKEIDQ